jgi:hypothetical protein
MNINYKRCEMMFVYMYLYSLTGTPIPGFHFIEYTFPRPVYNITEITVDFENAYSNTYEVAIYCSNTNSWRKLFVYRQFKKGSVWKSTDKISDMDVNHLRIKHRYNTSYQHVYHNYSMMPLQGFDNSTNPCVPGARDELDTKGYLTKVKMHKMKPAEKWGVSVWRWLIWGYPSI